MNEKSIMISLSPYWYYLIGEHIKTIEVRKTFPKAYDWNNTVECYMTKDKKSFARIPKELQEKYAPHMGKVGMKFVCDRIYQYSTAQNVTGVDITDDEMTSASMLTKTQIRDYEFSAEEKENCIYKIGVYGWHITDLNIHDEPKELSEFFKACNKPEGTDCSVCIDRRENNCEAITRPPQSWCYVENLQYYKIHSS